MTPNLIQRFLAPPKKTGSPLDNAHRVFGGAAMQLSKEAWDLLDQIFTVDYMGSAEFEFGELPKCLTRIISANDLYVRGSTEVTPFNDARKYRKDLKLPDPTPKRVWFFCHQKHAELLPALLQQLAVTPLKHRLQEDPRVAQTLDPVSKFDGDTQAWLDIQNDYFFSHNPEMFSKFADMLGINGTA